MEGVKGFVDVSRDERAVAQVHAFLLPHFGEAELEPLSHYLAQARGGGAVESIIVARWDGDGVCAAAIGALIPLTGERVLGAVGHALVDRRLRGQGAGRQLNAALEERLAHYAKLAGCRLEAFILESEADARFFWGKVGYRWPEGCRYSQPPLRYAADGSPDLPTIPLLLLLRHPEHSDAIPGPLVREYLQTMLVWWYRDDLADSLVGAALARAEGWLTAEIIAPSVASLVGAQVALIDPNTMTEAWVTAWLAAD